MLIPQEIVRLNQPITLTIIGAEGVGKSCIVLHLAQKTLPPHYHPTELPNFTRIDTPERNIGIFDTSGKSTLRFMLKNYTQQSQVVLICIELSQNFDQETANAFLHIAQKTTQNIIIIGTKPEQALMKTQEELQQWCSRHHCPLLSIDPYHDTTGEQRQMLLDIVFELAQKSQKTPQISPELLTAQKNFLTLLHHESKYKYKFLHMQALAQQTIKNITLDKSLGTQQLQQLEKLYLQYSSYTTFTQYIIASHLINIFSKTMLLLGNALLGVILSQTNLILGLLITANVLAVSLIAEHHYAPQSGHLFGFFTPTDNAASIFIRTCQTAFNKEFSTPSLESPSVQV